MLALDNLPPLPAAATVALIGLLGCFWVAMKVNILRRRMDRREPDEPPVPAPRWQRRLAAWRGTYPVLLLVAAGLAVLLVLSLRT